MTLHGRGLPLSSSPVAPHRSAWAASSQEIHTPRASSPKPTGPAKSAVPAEARGRALSQASSTFNLAAALATPKLGGTMRAQASSRGSASGASPTKLMQPREASGSSQGSQAVMAAAPSGAALSHQPAISHPSSPLTHSASTAGRVQTGTGGCQRSPAPARASVRRCRDAGAARGASPEHRPTRAVSAGCLDTLRGPTQRKASSPQTQRHSFTPQIRCQEGLAEQQPLRREAQTPSETPSDEMQGEASVEPASDEKAKKGGDSGRSSVGRQSTTAPPSRSPRARVKADTSPHSSVSLLRRDSSVLLLRADSVLSRVETCSSTSSLCRETASAPGSARGVPSVPMASGSILAARARHRACVAHLRSICEQVEELEAENAALRYNNQHLQQTIMDLQVKHDAAQCHLDATITLAVTPRTRRTLEAQKKRLQPALGALASGYVEAMHHRAQREKVNRQYQQGSPEETCTTKSGTDAQSPEPVDAPPPDEEDSAPMPSE